MAKKPKKPNPPAARRVVPDPSRDYALLTGTEQQTIITDRPLTPAERTICTQIITNGIEWLSGQPDWSPGRVGEFIARPYVRRELGNITAAVRDGPVRVERQRILARIQMMAMVPLALDIVRRTLLGERTVDGKIVPPPTSEQYRAAQDVLSRAGVDAAVEANITVNAVDPTLPAPKQSGRDHSDRSDQTAIITREKTVATIERIAKLFKETDDRIDALRAVTKKRDNA